MTTFFPLHSVMNTFRKEPKLAPRLAAYASSLLKYSSGKHCHKLRVVVVAFASLVLSGFTSYGQLTGLKTSIVSVGYGFPVMAKQLRATDNAIAFSAKGRGPAFLKYEYRMHHEYGVSLNLYASQINGAYNANNNGFYHYKFNLNLVGAMLRLNYYFTAEGFDLFVGGGGGIQRIDGKLMTDDPKYSGSNAKLQEYNFIVEGTVGIRFFAGKNLGIHSEVGIGRCIFQAGLCYKMEPKLRRKKNLSNNAKAN